MNPRGCCTVTLFIAILMVVELPKTEAYYGVNMQELSKYCEACMLWGGAPFYKHPKHCHKYIHCFYGSNNTVLGTEMNCPERTFWSQDDLTCRPQNEVKCKHDPCKLPGRTTYSDGRTCNGYWKCRGDALPHKKCCPKGQRYDDGKEMCINDKNCTEGCQKKFQLTDNFLPQCDSRAFEGDNRYYMRRVQSGAFVKMPCSPGTRFNIGTCSCSEYDEDFSTEVECLPFFYFPLDTDFRDKTYNDLRTGDVNVKIQAAAGATGGKAAYFDGKSKLTVWALNNMEFGSHFALTFRFKADGPTYRKDNRYDRNLPVALVDNSDCDRNATFGIALSSDGVSGTVFGGFLLEDSSIITRNVGNIPMGSWHDVRLVKDDSYFELKVDNTIVTGEAAGNIKRHPCSMTIGMGTGLNNFRGFIDDIRFYKCNPGSKQEQKPANQVYEKVKPKQ
ncbi:uncharacterized protein LOC135469053 [Liolophura sinensis]|uniref:uncharacterized protein LOC135469053 n=1 Tax=Liolophura sinensis TaxID=3198878 RepID=UPI00315921EC